MPKTENEHAPPIPAHRGIARRRFMLGAGAALASVAPGIRYVSAAPRAFLPDLETAVAALERKTGGRIGVAVLDVASGRNAGHRASELFPLCSTFKVLAAAALLDRADAGKEKLNRRIAFKVEDLQVWSPVTRARVGDPGMTLAELCEATITHSDNSAANVILAALGGPGAVTAYARRLKDSVTRLDRIEPDLNEAIPGDPRDTTSPQAMAANLRVLAFGEALSPASTTLLINWMRASTTGVAKLRAGLPKGWTVGDKTGSGGHGTTNDVALIWPPRASPLAVSVYMTQTTASADICNAAFADIARMISKSAG